MALLQRMRCRPVFTSVHAVMSHSYLLSLRMSSSCSGPTRPFFAYGEANFASIRESNKFFADNSRFIKGLEQEPQSNILLRPPRFGKSLFANMLARYYDVNTTEEQFERWFGGLDIFEHAKGNAGVKEARQYHVLELDFTIGVGPRKGLDRRACIAHSLRLNIYAGLKRFASTYGLSVDIRETNIAYSLESVADAIHSRGGRLYVIVDEYDRFANKLMLDADVGVYECAGTSAEALSSPIQSFFETLKVLAKDGTFRSFTTGITPIALADGSGANNICSLTHCSVRLSLGTVKDAVWYPTEWRWHQLIEDAFVLRVTVAALCDNGYAEYDMWSALRSSFGQVTRGMGDASHESELKVEMLECADYVDILVRIGGSGVLLELKRLRPREIEFTSETIMKNREKETHFVANDISEELGGMTEEELCKVKLVGTHKNGATVGDVLDSACKQAAKHTALKESHGLDRLHGFGVVSVATRIIVRDAELNV